MNNAVLIQQVWIGSYPNGFGSGSYEPMMELTKERNEAYCRKHNFDYVYKLGVDGLRCNDIDAGCWTKIELIQQTIEQGYEYIVWLDPDALIADMETDLRLGCIDGIGACWHRIPQLNHWNVGVLFIKNTPEVKTFIDEWLSAYPGPRDGWNEQGVFNKMAMKSRVVQTISDRWNATLNYSFVPDAVVIGYHGNGDAAKRLAMMKGTLEKLAQKAQGVMR
jgi:hypothetical protein